MKTKQCRKCLKVKPVHKFHRQGDHSDGYSSHCSECISERQRELYAKRRDSNYIDTIRRLPEKRFCPRCNETKPTSEFHRNRNAHDDCSPYCKPCTSEYYKNRRRKAK